MKRMVAVALLTVSVLATQQSFAGRFFMESAKDQAKLDSLAGKISDMSTRAAEVRELLKQGEHSRALKAMMADAGVKTQLSKSTGLEILSIQALVKREETAMAMISLHASGNKEAIREYVSIMDKISDNPAAQDIVSFIAIEASTKDSAKAELSAIAKSKDGKEVRESIEKFAETKKMSYAELLEFIRKCLKA